MELLYIDMVGENGGESRLVKCIRSSVLKCVV